MQKQLVALKATQNESRLLRMCVTLQSLSDRPELPELYIPLQLNCTCAERGYKSECATTVGAAETRISQQLSLAVMDMAGAESGEGRRRGGGKEERGWGKGAHRVEVLVGVGVHEELVVVVRYAPAVLYYAHHVPHRLPRGPTRLLGLHVQQVVLHMPCVMNNLPQVGEGVYKLMRTPLPFSDQDCKMACSISTYSIVQLAHIRLFNQHKLLLFNQHSIQTNAGHILSLQNMFSLISMLAGIKVHVGRTGTCTD